jgi:hypothetical protein
MRSPESTVFWTSDWQTNIGLPLVNSGKNRLNLAVNTTTKNPPENELRIHGTRS